MEGEGEQIRGAREEKCTALNIFLRALHAAFTLWHYSTEDKLVYSLFSGGEQWKFSASVDVKGFMLLF